MLTLICGVPNAGKTTHSARYQNVFHLDEIGGTSKVAELVSDMSGDVVVEGVFSTSKSRRRLIEAYNGKAKCIFLDVPLEEILRREDRGRPEWLLRNAMRHFIPPDYAEGWDEIEVIR